MANIQTAAVIGSINVHGLSGRLSSHQRILDEYARVGKTGSGSQSVGRRGRTSTIEIWVGSSTSTEANKLADDLEEMQGSVARIQDDFGRVFERVRIKTAEASVKRGLGTTLPSGVQMTYLVRATMTIEVLP